MKKLLVLCLLLTFSSGVSAYDCSKKKCSEISSCAEAKYKLKKCGMTKLNRDKDGVPCENVCPGG